MTFLMIPSAKKGSYPFFDHEGGTVTRVAIALLVAGGALTFVQAQQARPFDLLITNARIIDGTGGPSVTGSVAVRGGRIAGVGRVSGAATRTLNAGGKVLSPGFIDPHSHSDLTLLTDGNAESKIRQGVTTEVIGESGSVAPRKPGAGQEWTDFTGYFAAIERSKSAVNLLSYVGLGQVREYVMGHDERAPTPKPSCARASRRRSRSANARACRSTCSTSR